jgi:hypothetical protein
VKKKVTYLEEEMKKDKSTTTFGNTIRYKTVGLPLEIHL